MTILPRAIPQPTGPVSPPVTQKEASGPGHRPLKSDSLWPEKNSQVHKQTVRHPYLLWQSWNLFGKPPTIVFKLVPKDLKQQAMKIFVKF